jgi:hypothetical protein
MPQGPIRFRLAELIRVTERVVSRRRLTAVRGATPETRKRFSIRRADLLDSTHRHLLDPADCLKSPHIHKPSMIEHVGPLCPRSSTKEHDAYAHVWKHKRLSSTTYSVYDRLRQGNSERLTPVGVGRSSCARVRLDRRSETQRVGGSCSVSHY